MNRVYIDGLIELPVSYKECKIRGNTNWVCTFVEWEHNIPIIYQKVSVSEKEWYDGNWKHPDCPLKIEDMKC